MMKMEERWRMKDVEEERKREREMALPKIREFKEVKEVCGQLAARWPPSYVS